MAENPTRAMDDPTGGSSRPKRRRLIDLTPAEELSNGITAELRKMLELTLEELKKLKKIDVQNWAEAVMRQGFNDDEGDIARAKTILNEKGITGSVLASMGADVKGFKDLGLDDGPAVLLADQMKFLMSATGEVGTTSADPASERSRWLDAAIALGTEGWDADHVESFDTNILGNAYMGNRLIVRRCYLTLHRLVTDWLHSRLADPQSRCGVCVVTGTPGIGKSVFQSYMAIRLAQSGFSIVLQVGSAWLSRKAGGPAVEHREDKPVALLEESSFVLLADPLGGANAVPVQHRTAGCTVVFTSPNYKNYATAWQQSEASQALFIMPLWSCDEVVRHRAVVLPQCQEEEQATKAYRLLGGSPRWLRKLMRESNGVGMDEAAAALIDDALANVDYDGLIKALAAPLRQASGPAGGSELSHIVQLDTQDCKNFTLKLLDSDVALKKMQEKLDVLKEHGESKFLSTALDNPVLGALYGRVFQKALLRFFTGKNAPRRKLSCRSLSSPGTTVAVMVPNAGASLPLLATKPATITLQKDLLYNPDAADFPAADFFFVCNGTLWLLQVTKDARHPCRIEALYTRMRSHVLESSLGTITAINWVVLAPKAIAEKYTATQAVEGTWKISAPVAVRQYVHAVDVTKL